jgi:muramoyltetrapeptide carboxypeptidase LdcA involved in peptidoglycan recycling
MVPEKLKQGDEVRVIAPSQSMAIISKETREIANKRFKDLGLKLSFGKHIEESDMFNSSSIESRVEDFNQAFADKDVKAVLTVIGGFNCNQLLNYIDWENVKNNPKIFCGYSDTTALNNAIYAKTGLVNYSGPAYSTFGMIKHFEYSLEYFKKALFSNNSFEVKPADEFTDDRWYLDQENRKPMENEGFWVLQKGEAQGKIIGGNASTLYLLDGTEFRPKFEKNTILFLEDDEWVGEGTAVNFDRLLQHYIHQEDFKNVAGLVIGRFQLGSKMTREKLEYIVSTKKELRNMPVIANVDFGHTSPIITLPIGGTVDLKVKQGKININIK